MGSPRRTARSKKHRDGAKGRDIAPPSPHVERLRQRFAKFRREHPSGTRIPDSLRNAALAALRCGTPPSELRGACAITSSQLTQWQKHQQAGALAPDLAEPAPRVFPVVDDLNDVANPGVAPTRRDAHQDLELRIGGWAICIRQVGA